MKILIVEDNEDLMNTLTKQLLLSSQYEIDSTNNGSKALELINSKVYDVIILDIILPNIDGLKLLERIKIPNSINFATFIIVTTGITHPSIIKNVEGLGANYFLTKPYEFQTIKSILNISQRLNRSSNYNHKPPTFIDDFTNEYLAKYKIREHLKGYNLITQAFKYLIEIDSTFDVRVTKDIYPYLAKLNNTDTANIERNIRNAITQGNSNIKENNLSNFSFLLKMRKEYFLTNNK